MPNSDQESDYIYQEIKKFISNSPNSKLIKSLEINITVFKTLRIAYR